MLSQIVPDCCNVVQSKFKHATCSVVGQADARSFAVGAERVSYEGPLRVRLPVKKKLDPNGDFSFEIPLPNPDRQVLVKRFAGGLKGALKSPLTAQSTQTTSASGPYFVQANFVQACAAPPSLSICSQVFSEAFGVSICS